MKAKEFSIIATLLRTEEKIGKFSLQSHYPCNYKKGTKLVRSTTGIVPNALIF